MVAGCSGGDPSSSSGGAVSADGGTAGHSAGLGTGGGRSSLGSGGGSSLGAGGASSLGTGGVQGAGGSAGASGLAGGNSQGSGGAAATGGAGGGAQASGGSTGSGGRGGAEAGSGGSDSGAAGGSVSSADSGSEVDACEGGTTYAASSSAKATVDGYGWVLLEAPTKNNQIVEFDTTMTVPATPAATGTLFLWPGLQPLQGGTNYDTLDNGVLQPVLTWGPTCAPNSPSQSYKSWWISGQYVNTYITTSNSNYQKYNGCLGGPGMSVEVGDLLDMRFVLSGTDWTQTVTDRRNSQSVSYTLGLLGQAQNMAEFVIEEYSSKPVSDVIFTDSVITFAFAAASSCQPAQRGTNDYFSAPRASADGKRCCISKVILRAEGVTATSPDSP